MLHEVHNQQDKRVISNNILTSRFHKISSIQTKFCFFLIHCSNQEHKHKTHISNSKFFWIYVIPSENDTELWSVGIGRRKNLPPARFELVRNGTEASESYLVGGCGDGAKLEDRHVGGTRHLDSSVHARDLGGGCCWHGTRRLELRLGLRRASEPREKAHAGIGVGVRLSEGGFGMIFCCRLASGFCTLHYCRVLGWESHSIKCRFYPCELYF